jgi:hypothetical protein
MRVGCICHYHASHPVNDRLEVSSDGLVKYPVEPLK